MARRRTLAQIRKYFVIFFVVLLVFIYCNHGSEKQDANSLEKFPMMASKAESAAPKAAPPGKLPPVQHAFRSERLYQLIEQQKLMHKPKKLVVPESTTRESVREATAADTWTSTAAKPKPKSSSRPARYFVNSQKCKMPYADPFSHELLEIYNPSKFKVCSNETDLITLIYNAEKKLYQLHVNKELVPKLWKDVKHFRCHYREVTRGTNKSADNYSDIGSPIYFQQNAMLPRHLDSIMVECHDAHNESYVLQQDAFPLVQVLNGTESRVASHPLERKPSVIMLGLDSMSRMNFQRTMPLTAKFVTQLGWYEMEGYNKVADNTLPNLLPVLAGYKVSQLKRYAGLDRVPWIWNDYKNAGYSTALGEDVLQFGLFTLGMPGFEQVPTDYYLRTLLLGIDEAMRIYMRFGYQYCIGRRLTIGYVYDFCTQLVQRYVEELDQPVFGFFWSCTFTHDFYFGAASLDAKLVEYLRVLEGHQMFERAIVILFSDHGARYGDLMELSDSFLEERLPMLHISLPPWFHATYPKYVTNLRENRNRLSSNFDLHNTLRHILQLQATTVEELPALKFCPTSQSLFHPLPKERSCEDACITDHWCTCNEFIKMPKNGDMYYLAKLSLYHMNRYLVKSRLNKLCHRLILYDLDLAERKVIFDEDGKESMYGNMATFRLRFRAGACEPMFEGKFQVTLHFNRELKKIENFDMAEVSRLNSYHNNSLCVDDKMAKKFCICTNIINCDPDIMAWHSLTLRPGGKPKISK